MSNRVTKGEALAGRLFVNDDANVAGDLTVSGSVSFGDQQDAIADPTGGDTQDDEARTAIGAIIDALEAVGILEVSE